MTSTIISVVFLLSVVALLAFFFYKVFTSSRVETMQEEFTRRYQDQRYTFLLLANMEIHRRWYKASQAEDKQLADSYLKMIQDYEKQISELKKLL